MRALKVPDFVIARVEDLALEKSAVSGESKASFYRLLENRKLLIVGYLRRDLIAVPWIKTARYSGRPYALPTYATLYHASTM